MVIQALPQMQNWERGEASPAVFENLKSIMIFERKSLIVSIFELEFSFKCSYKIF